MTSSSKVQRLKVTVKIQWFSWLTYFIKRPSSDNMLFRSMATAGLGTKLSLCQRTLFLSGLTTIKNAASLIPKRYNVTNATELKETPKGSQMLEKYKLPKQSQFEGSYQEEYEKITKYCLLYTSRCV